MKEKTRFKQLPKQALPLLFGIQSDLAGFSVACTHHTCFRWQQGETTTMVTGIELCALSNVTNVPAAPRAA